MDDVTRRRRLLLILYLSFISLGLPDAILGAAWPKMRADFDKGLEYGGLLLSLTTVVSVVAGLVAGFSMARLRVGLLVTVCGFLTAWAMIGYSFSPDFVILIFFTMIFGLGQGAVDTAVNFYMAENYSSRNMSWVHCCWSLGAFAGPLVMTLAFSLNASWRAGYLAIGCFQMALAFVFLKTLPLWPRKSPTAKDEISAEDPGALEKAGPPKIGRVRLAVASLGGILFYLFYPGLEVVTGLWGASFLIEERGADAASASFGLSLFWGALTLGRFLNGFWANLLANRNQIRAGLLLALLGLLLLWLAGGLKTSLAALALMGLGLSALYPAMMHDTPARLGSRDGGRVVGFQVGAALAGATFFPAAVGLAAKYFSLAALIPSLLGFLGLVFLCHEISFRASLLNMKH